MERLRRINRSKAGIRVWMGLMFAVMLVLNCLTPYVADDWVYRLSFATKEPIRSVLDIFPSMAVHSTHMNGRLISHGLLQLFFIPPNIVFKLCNAAAFCAVMYLSYRLCRRGRGENLLLLAALSMAFFCVLPVFGQVCLWRDGAVNYLWAMLWGLLYLTPFVRLYQGEGGACALWKKILFCLYALPVGAYTEVMSFLVTALGAALILCTPKGRKTWLWLPTALAAAGYAVLLSMPAEMNAKGGAMGLLTIAHNVSVVTALLGQHLRLPLLAWAALLVLALYRREEGRRVLLSILLLLAALAGSYMMVVAANIPERCLSMTTLLLLTACGVLLAGPEKPKQGKPDRALLPLALCTALTAVAFAFSLVAGAYDVGQVYYAIRQREAYIAQAKAQGQTDLVLEVVRPRTKYSANWETLDLNTEVTDQWPNLQMAEYYGVDSILGRQPE